jgi:hypothetical protein
MPHPLIRGALLLLALAGTNACGETATGLDEGDASGVWRGAGRGVDLELVLTQYGSKVTGVGRIRTTSVVSVTASGFNDPGGLSVTLSAHGQGDITVIGPFSDRATVQALLIGNGWYAEPIVLHRERMPE